MDQRDAQLLIEQCELEVRAGRADLVARRLASLNRAKLPRRMILPLANICRRASLIRTGLRLLAPIVRPETQTEPATAAENAEYAFLMMKNGSLSEALRLLNSIDERALAEATLYTGFCHMFRWEYDRAVIYLEKYLASGPAEYQSLIGKVNLISALIALGRYEEANSIIFKVLQTCSEKNYSRLAGNCLELRSQIHLSRENFDLCREDLEAARVRLGAERSSDQLLIMKWLAFVESVQTGTLDAIDKFREEARARRHWESLRECDFFSLKVRFDQSVFDRLHHGTIFEAYRRRLESVWNTKPSASSYLVGGGQILDLRSGSIGKDFVLKPGSKIHRAIDVLTRDFYRPLPIGTLFAEIFPNEYFDPFSSTNRVHQLLWRVRDWLSESQFRAQLKEEDGLFRLVSETGFGFRVDREELIHDRMHAHWSALRARFAGQGRFKSVEAQELLNISSTTFRKLVKWATDQGRLAKTGESRATWYEIKSAA